VDQEQPIPPDPAPAAPLDAVAGLDHAVYGGPEKPVLVLLHAGGMTRHEWDPFLAAWAPRFRLVVPTAPGHGASPADGALTVDSMADATLRLLDALGVERAHFLGSSMGGATSLRVALRRPDRVDRLILYRSGFRTGTSALAALRRMATPETWRHWGLEQWMQREHAPRGGPDEWRAVIRQVAAAFERPDASLDPADLARVAAPTLLIAGDRDNHVPLEDLVVMYRSIPEASLWIVPRAGHLMAMETWRRAAFLEEVRRFLEVKRQ